MRYKTFYNYFCVIPQKKRKISKIESKHFFGNKNKEQKSNKN